MKRILINTLMLCMAAATAMADQTVVSVSDTITDHNIVYPESFDNFTKDLLTDWYMNRYTALVELADKPQQQYVSDQEYIDRLQRMPTEIEMPYNQVVRDYIEMYALKRQQLVEKMLSLGLYYNPIFEDALEKYQIPLELKYLPVIESALNPNAVSKAGAAGLWQFMPSTATGEGLEVNTLVDERRDPIKSSDAAAFLLKKFYDIYGDWHLVLAAYNCGPGNVNKAIRNSGGKTDFWEIYYYLPKETRGYVPAFIAATYIMNNYGYHGISPAVARMPIVTDTVHVDCRLNFQQISDVMGLSIEEIRILNPQYRKDIIPGNNEKSYALILPSVQAGCFAANMDSIIAYNRAQYAPRAVVEIASGKDVLQEDAAVEASMRDSEADQAVANFVTKKHTVMRGETLYSIANKYGVTEQSIMEANNLTSNKIKRGKELVIRIPQPDTQQSIADDFQKAKDVATATPVTSSEPAKPATVPAKPATQNKQASSKSSKSTTTPNTSAASKPTSYTVKSGDTLSRIASRNGVTVDQLKKANGLKSDVLHPGQKLTIPTKAPAKKSTSTKKSSKKRR